TLAGARQHDPTAFGPVDLTVMDRPVPLARDQHVLRETDRKQPVEQRASVVADDARPNAWLPLAAVGDRHGSLAPEPTPQPGRFLGDPGNRPVASKVNAIRPTPT